MPVSEDSLLLEFPAIKFLRLSVEASDILNVHAFRLSLFLQKCVPFCDEILDADGTRKEEADYKYKYENGLLVKYGKELTGSDITGEYIGIGRFSKDFMPEFMEKLDGMIRTQQHSVWWENILYEMVGKRPVYVEEMDGLFWAEVDYVEDYERILRFRGYKADFSLNVEKI